MDQKCLELLMRIEWDVAAKAYKLTPSSLCGEA